MPGKLQVSSLSSLNENRVADGDPERTLRDDIPQSATAQTTNATPQGNAERNIVRGEVIDWIWREWQERHCDPNGWQNIPTTREEITSFVKTLVKTILDDMDIPEECIKIEEISLASAEIDKRSIKSILEFHADETGESEGNPLFKKTLERLRPDLLDTELLRECLERYEEDNATPSTSDVEESTSDVEEAASNPPESPQKASTLERTADMDDNLDTESTTSRPWDAQVCYCPSGSCPVSGFDGDWRDWDLRERERRWKYLNELYPLLAGFHDYVHTVVVQHMPCPTDLSQFYHDRRFKNHYSQLLAILLKMGEDEIVSFGDDLIAVIRKWLSKRNINWNVAWKYRFLRADALRKLDKRKAWPKLRQTECLSWLAQAQQHNTELSNTHDVPQDLNSSEEQQQHRENNTHDVNPNASSLEQPLAQERLLWIVIECGTFAGFWIMTRDQHARHPISSRASSWTPAPWPLFSPDTSEASFDRTTQEGFEKWVQWEYCMHAWSENGTFVGFAQFKDHLLSLEKSKNWAQIDATVRKLRDPTQKFAFPLNKTGGPMMHETREARKIMFAEWDVLRKEKEKLAENASELLDQAPPATPATGDESPPSRGTENDILARKLGQIQVDEPGPSTAQSSPQDAQSDLKDDDDSAFEESQAPEESQLSEEESDEPDFDAMDDLLGNNNRTEPGLDNTHETIRHAPLLDESLVRNKTLSSALPQYGLMGVHDQNLTNAASKLFLNTNVPFSAFVCGVQGSGKSHTTSCILENCLIPSKSLGKLQQPLSALVFSYGLWSGDGAGFNVSEAAFLGAPNPRFGGAHVRQINVLVSPTNFIRIKKKYERLPNVRVTSFRLNPKNLDIGLMLQLMQVDESAQGPLYLGEVQRILREIWASHEEFDYKLFKTRIEKHSDLDFAQRNMLNMRLGILEWFLDLKGEHREDVVFRPGEVTIMDLSCPFVDANTACIMFRCGLQRYLQTDASGKMIVLDEAHKYMLDVPGAKALQASIHHTIAVQRHQAVRCIVSSQEPTLLVKLIGLCSVSFIHRFTSPEWFTAIRQNIPIPDQDRVSVMRQIEGLPTGTAIVYSANSVVGYEGDQLKKGTGILMKVRMRERITTDGGQSILAV